MSIQKTTHLIKSEKNEKNVFSNTDTHTHTHQHNRFTALWNLSGKTRVSRYQKKHSPTTLIVVINHPYKH